MPTIPDEEHAIILPDGSYHYGLIRTPTEKTFAATYDLDLPEVDIGSLPESQGIVAWMQVEDQGNVGACFPSGTLITLDDGMQIPIEEIRFGMYVLSHNRKPRRVVDAMRREYSGDIVNVWIKGWEVLSMTKDHVVIVCRDGEEMWIRAGEIRSDDLMLLSSGVDHVKHSMIDVTKYSSDVCMMEDNGFVWHKNCSSHMPREIEINQLAAWCIGLYVAEGSSDFSSAGYYHRACWTLHENETEYASKLCEWAISLGLSAKVNKRKNSKAINIRVSCAVLASFLSVTCGRFCNKKQIPEFIMSATDEIKLAFMRGYYDGDGSSLKAERKRISANGNEVLCNQVASSTASKVLALQLATMQISLGMKPGRSVKKAASHQRYESHHNYLYSKDAVTLYPHIEPAKQQRRHLIQDYRGQWRKIREITTTTVVMVDVYDITVDEDHSFIAGGVAVHNCAGHARTSAEELAIYRQTKGDILQLSRQFAYVTAQKVDGIVGDRGSTIEGNAKASQTVGTCLESFAPYTGSYYTKFDPAAYENALNHRLQTWMRLRSYDDVLRWNVHGIGGVAIGIGWNGYCTPDSRGCIEQYKSGGGGHSLALLDWNKKFLDSAGRPYLWMFNSWSKRWGASGCAYIHPRVVDYWCKNETVIGYSDMKLKDITPRPFDWGSIWS